MENYNVFLRLFPKNYLKNLNFKEEVAEWLKAHAWINGKLFRGFNPLSPPFF